MPGPYARPGMDTTGRALCGSCEGAAQVGIEGVAEPNERTLTRQVRAAELTGVLDSLDPARSPSNNELDVLATLIFDAGVDADEVSLRLALDRLRDDYWRRSADPADPAPSDATRAGALLGF